MLAASTDRNAKLWPILAQARDHYAAGIALVEQALPSVAGVGVSVPSTGGDVWVWLRGDDRGVLLHRGRALAGALSAALVLADVVDAFCYDSGRDLSGYEDGTENPTGDDAQAAALVQGAGPGLDGGSFVAVQTWLHDLDRLAAMSPAARDHMVGRRQSDNAELEDAPDAAHVRRTAQEDFSPPAFVLRRSMPWSAGEQSGLVFVAFGHSFDAFEAQVHRMLGLEDGIVDGLFAFTRPVRGAYYFCPPVADGRLDLRALQPGG